MPMINFIGDGDGAGQDLAGKMDQVVHITDAPITLMGLRGGMQSGKNSLMLRIDLPDGRVLLAETSVAVFLTAATAVRAWDERTGGSA